MSRPAPRIAPRDIVAGAVIDPNGAHQLEVAVPSGVVAMRFSCDQVQSLKQAIERFEAETVRADGGPEFHHKKFIPLEIRR